jgi:CheY-like chemotaxis protein
MVVLLDLMMPAMSGLRLLHIVGGEPELAARHDFIL